MNTWLHEAEIQESTTPFGVRDYWGQMVFAAESIRNRIPS